MKIKILKTRKPQRDTLLLIEDDWNDWWKYCTLYQLFFYDPNGNCHTIGYVKIGQQGQESEKADLSATKFDELGANQFSLGQDESYYVNLQLLGDSLRDQVLNKLNDLSKDLDYFGQVIEEKVVRISLLRGVSVETVKGQFHRLATGGKRLTSFRFSYQTVPFSQEREATSINFEVEPESNPPTNIQVVIGRNGAGKTHLLQQMIQSLVKPNHRKHGKFYGDTFSGIVYVSFSAFDPVVATPFETKDKTDPMTYTYVGLKRDPDDRYAPSPKSPQKLASEFANSLLNCSRGDRKKRWFSAVDLLGTDPVFDSADIPQFMEHLEFDDYHMRIKKHFNRLSSGHKIVLLTITRLVEAVEEKTLVFMDEPEGYLHPPLLSTFIRAISQLLIDRNGVAIIATHSPVVLQEIPKSCVWYIRRVGAEVNFHRPIIETFGENVGVLTRDIFELEVTKSGYHILLEKFVKKYATFEEVVASFDGQIGIEGRALLRTMFARKAEDEKAK